MINISRRVLVPVAVASVVGFQGLRASKCEGDVSWPFDPKGLPTKFKADVAKDTTLYLTGVGTRRKNLYIVNVDVYQVGFALPSGAMYKALAWSTANKETRAPLTSFLLHPDPKPQPVKAAVILKPIRDISTAQFLSAIKDSFAGTNPEQFALFYALVEKVFGTNGITLTDQVVFYWMGNGDLVLVKNGTPEGSLRSDEIAHRLMDVYVDPKRSVAPELHVSIETNLGAVNTLSMTSK